MYTGIQNTIQHLMNFQNSIIGGLEVLSRHIRVHKYIHMYNIKNKVKQSADK